VTGDPGTLPNCASPAPYSELVMTVPAGRPDATLTLSKNCKVSLGASWALGVQVTTPVPPTFGIAMMTLPTGKLALSKLVLAGTVSVTKSPTVLDVAEVLATVSVYMRDSPGITDWLLTDLMMDRMGGMTV
jgi:hypothetical protein